MGLAARTIAIALLCALVSTACAGPGAGAPAVLTVLRDGQQQDVPVVLAERPSNVCP
jgi:hypothetical protein